jgi:hypothetical protein
MKGISTLDGSARLRSISSLINHVIPGLNQKSLLRLIHVIPGYLSYDLLITLAPIR